MSALALRSSFPGSSVVLSFIDSKWHRCARPWQQSAFQRSRTGYGLFFFWREVWKAPAPSPLTTSNLFLCDGQMALQLTEQISLSVCMCASNFLPVNSGVLSVRSNSQSAPRGRICHKRRLFPFTPLAWCWRAGTKADEGARDAERASDRGCAIDLSSPRRAPPPLPGAREEGETGCRAAGFQQQSRSQAEIPH